MDFGDAIRALKEGKRVARSGWNGRGLWLVLVHPINGARFALPGGADAAGQQVISPEPWDKERPAYCVRFPIPVDDDAREKGVVGVASWSEYRQLPWIGMKTADDCFVPWLASQTDMLSGEDWVIVE
jgi:hypothetical protein